MDEILNLIESVSEGFLSYSFMLKHLLVVTHSIKPRARYGLSPRRSFVDHDFLKAQCLRSILQHVCPLAVGILRGNSLL